MAFFSTESGVFSSGQTFPVASVIGMYNVYSASSILLKALKYISKKGFCQKN